jgi:hypothetical protein
MEFKHKLPAMKVEGRDCGNYNKPGILGIPAVNDTRSLIRRHYSFLRKIVRDERRLIL